MRSRDRSPRGIIQTEIDVNFWAESPPSVAAVRPARCVDCGAAARPPGRKLVIHGHGKRGRTVIHPLSPDADSATARSILVRRYRCTACGAILLVGPSGLLAHRRYSAAAIALALTLWSAVAMCARAVRAAFSAVPFASFAHTSWPSMLRWVDAIVTGRLFVRIHVGPGSPRRERAGRAVSAIRAFAPPTLRGSLRHEVFAGARFAALPP